MLSGTVRYVGEENRRNGDDLDNSRKVTQSRRTGLDVLVRRGPLAAPTVLLSIPGMHQALDSPPSPVVCDGLPGRTRDPLQDWKTAAPRFSSFSAGPFPVVLFRGHTDNVLALHGVFSVGLPLQRRGRTRDPTARGGRAVT